MPTKAELEAEIAALRAKLATHEPTNLQEVNSNPPDPGSDASSNEANGKSAPLPLPVNAISGPSDSESELERLIAEKIYSDLGFAYHRSIMMFRLVYSLCGLFLGLACIIGGIAMFFGGIAGATKWTATILGASSEISDAAPGAVLFIVGLFIVVATRFSHRSISSGSRYFRS